MIRRMPVRFLIASLSVVCISLAAGCNRDGPGQTMLEARPQPYVQDIPVPRGFNRDEGRSRYSTTAGRRAVTDYYMGKEPMLLVRNFYSHNMPQHGWQAVGEALNDRDQQPNNGVYELNYKKGDQHCEVRIERMPKGGLFGGEVTQVRVTVPETTLERPD